MQDNQVSPWQIQRQNEPHNSLHKPFKLSQSLVRYQPVSFSPREQKVKSSRSTSKMSHEQKLVRVRMNLARSSIDLNRKCSRKKVEVSPVSSPRINKKVKSILKLQVQKLEGESVNSPLKKPLLKIPQIPLKIVPKTTFLPKTSQQSRSLQQRQREMKSPLHSGVKVNRRRVQTRGKMYKKMLQDQFIFLNQKIENMFMSTRASNIQLSINKLIKKKDLG